MGLLCFLWAYARSQVHALAWTLRDLRQDHRTVSIFDKLKCVHLECVCGKVFWSRPAAEAYIEQTRVIFNMGAKSGKADRAKRGS